MTEAPPPAFLAEATLADADLAAAEAWLNAATERELPRNTNLPALLLGLGGSALAVALLHAMGLVWSWDDAVLALGTHAFAFALGVVALRWLLAVRFRRIAALRRDSSGFLRERRRWAFDAEGIRVAGPTSEGLWRWSGLTEAARRGEALVFRVGVAHVFPVPVRAFPDEAAAEAALRFAQGWIAAAARQPR